jgi:hypothetical protein
MSICSRINSLYVPAKNPGSNSRLIAAFILFFARQVITSSGITSNLINGRPLTSAELSSISATIVFNNILLSIISYLFLERNCKVNSSLKRIAPFFSPGSFCMIGDLSFCFS